MYSTICNIISSINNLLWGPVTIIIILAAAIFLSLRLGFVQFRALSILKKNCPQKERKNGLELLRLVSTALGASMGTGNIIGVATAISVGGCGAVFWMVVSSFFVMVFAFTENALGMKYKISAKKDCTASGPILYIEKGLGSKKAALIYAIACMLSSFGIGNMSQVNSAAGSLSYAGVPLYISGAAFALLAGIVIFRGRKFISKVAGIIVPLMSVMYILGSLVLIIIYGKNIPEISELIVKSAFGFDAVLGGISGAAVKSALTVGLRRGVFSNEAGMGSSVFSHTDFDCGTPGFMGACAVLEVFADTVICCTLTAFVILLTGADSCGAEGAGMIISAFENGLGDNAGIFVVISNCLFAFAAILGWYYYGEKCAAYISPSPRFRSFYRILYIVLIFAGSIININIVWDISDILNAFVLFPNLAAILILSREALPYSKNSGNNC